jgi:hypothetical protein
MPIFRLNRKGIPQARHRERIRAAQTRHKLTSSSVGFGINARQGCFGRFVGIMDPLGRSLFDILLQRPALNAPLYIRGRCGALGRSNAPGALI